EMPDGTHVLVPELFGGRPGLTTEANATLALVTNDFANFKIGEEYEILVASGNLTIISSGVATIEGPRLWGPGSRVKCSYLDAGHWVITGGWHPAVYSTGTLPAPSGYPQEQVLVTNGGP